MTLDECLRTEVAALVAAVDEAAPRLADHRPWWLRLARSISGVLL